MYLTLVYKTHLFCMHRDNYTMHDPQPADPCFRKAVNLFLNPTCAFHTRLDLIIYSTWLKFSREPPTLSFTAAVSIFHGLCFIIFSLHH